MGDAEKMREDKKVKKERKSETTSEIRYSEIEKLTDDCLIQIFQHLTTIADKIRIERVCKKWQNVSQRSWNNFKSLNLLAETWGRKENLDGEISIRSIDFDKIVRLSGRYLTSISLVVDKFAKICYFLPKIQDLQLTDDCLDQNKQCPDKYSNEFAYQSNKQKKISQCTYNSWQVIISWLRSHGNNITIFKLYVTHSHYKEEDFVRFLGEMKQLKCFHLYNCEYLDWSGTCLLQLPFETIEEIFLMSTYNLTFDRYIMPLMIKKCKNLKGFGIEGGEGHVVDGIMEVLPSQANTLTKLKLQFEEIDNSSVLLSTMSALVHLEKIIFSCCFNVTDAFLEVLGKHCKKLTYLDLYGCRRITDRGISSICDLEKVTYLNMSGLPEIKNPPLDKLTSLVFLHSYLNKNIEEECLCSVLEKAHQLRGLDVNYCSFVTNKLLNVAAEVVRRRNSNIGLDLCVTGTLININSLHEKPTLLNFIEDQECMKIDNYGIVDPFLEISDEEVSIH